MSELILSTDKLSKHYGRIKALNQLDLKIERGNVYGILGPNGSGKTTFLGTILGILKPHSGSFQWFDYPANTTNNKRVGVLLETPNFYPYLNADENLDIVRRIKGLPSQDFTKILNIVNLEKRRSSDFRSYSLGMKQRLAIAATLIGEPDVLIFDEPTNGLDPVGISDVRKVMQDIAQLDKTVIMASHILDEVEKICSHVAILKNGQLLAQGPIGQILKDDQRVEIIVNDIDRLLPLIQELSAVQIITRTGDLLSFDAPSDFDLDRFSKRIFEEGLIIRHLICRNQRLEEEFIALTK